MAAEEANAESRLLALPPELRNRIYRYTLVQHSRIRIEADGPLPPEPGLLRACRQIRTEAKSIYLKENCFSFKVPGFNSSNLIRWNTLSRAHQTSSKSVETTCLLEAPHNWRNLLVWLEACYHKVMKSYPIAAPKANKEMNTVAHLFDVMKELRGKHGLSWKQIEPVLESTRRAIAETNPAWRI